MNTLHLFLLLSSWVLFILGIQRAFVRGTTKFHRFGLAGYSLFFITYSLFYLVSYYFTGHGIDHAVIYHVKYGVIGGWLYEYSILVTLALISLVLGVMLIYYVLIRGASDGVSKGLAGIIQSMVLVVLSGCVHPATMDLYNLRQEHDGEPFFKYYKKPGVYQVSEKRNFIFIYLESLERTYFDQKLFPNLTNNLKSLEEEGISFTEIGGFPQTGWTIAGMVGSQCGIPLVSLSHGNSMAGMDSFLAGATCMGDLLSEQGYHLTYLGGAPLEFAGKGKFYQSHGFENVLGRDELIPLLPEGANKTGWGLYDEDLFEIAFEKFENSSKAGEQFGIVMLTLDTHGSDNHFSKSCRGRGYGNGKNGMLNAVSCSDKLVYDFIRRIQGSPFYDNTVIVVASDHFAMRNSAYGKLKKGKRRNLFFILDPQRSSAMKIESKGSTLDIGPVVLDVLGVKSQLGLGRNLLGGEVSIKDQIADVGKTFSGWKEEMMQFWSFPRISNNITVHGKEKYITIDGRKFKTPVLVEFDKKLRTNLRFQIYNDAPHHKSLFQHLEKFQADDPFLMIDNCLRMRKYWGKLAREGLCVAGGKMGAKELVLQRIPAQMVLTSTELKKMAAAPVDNGLFNQRLEELRHDIF